MAVAYYFASVARKNTYIKKLWHIPLDQAAAWPAFCGHARPVPCVFQAFCLRCSYVVVAKSLTLHQKCELFLRAVKQRDYDNVQINYFCS